MKRIINGKMYNTETAELLGCNMPIENRRDFYWFGEWLYRKKNGEFFLEYEGSCMSIYAVSCGMNERSGSSGIRPLTEEEAKEWLEEYGDADTYIAIFGEPKE